MLMAFKPITGKFQVIPGTITLDDGSTATYTFNDLVALYNVDLADCVLGPITGLNEARYIKLKPRADGTYIDMDFQTELGGEISAGPEFDGKKKYMQETNPETFYTKRESEQQL